jgi:hypothetical protein
MKNRNGTPFWELCNAERRLKGWFNLIRKLDKTLYSLAGSNASTMSYAPSYQSLWIPAGRPGTLQTLHRMRELAREDHHLPQIQALALHSHDPLGLDAYLREHWHYKPDPVEFEFVMGPRYQLELASGRGYFEGDCDDAATLAGAVLLALHWPARLTAYRMMGNPEFEHVNVRTVDYSGRDGIFDIDPTVPADRLPIRHAEEILEVAL